jgi:O-glycosyl hydrolase
MVIASCSSTGSSSGTGGSNSSGGSAVGGSSGKGGSGQGGTTSSGGSSGNGGAASGGATGSGGVISSGGTTGSGGKATGGSTSSGGATGKGGSTSAGGVTGSGGTTGGGGTTSAGGATGAGGGTAAGGSTGAGGETAAGGSTGAGGGTSTGVTVQLDSTHQTIEGFGINDTWNSLSATQAKNIFDATSGIGMTILRVGMSYNSTTTSAVFYNGSSEGSNISAAKSAGATKIIGSVWTAPANMKDNSSLTGGGHLKSTNYDAWATSIANFAGTNGLYAMGVANEPDFASCGSNDPCNGDYDTMVYTANEMVAFIKVVGPKLQALNPPVKVIAPEASEWIHQWSNISAGPDVNGKNSSDPLKCGCFGMAIDSTTAAKCASKCASGDGYDYGHFLAADATAWAAFDIIGVHQYDSQIAYAWPSDVTAAKKEIWETEMSGVKWWPEQGVVNSSGEVTNGSTTIENGVAVAGWLHSALVVGDAAAWLWWWYAPLSSGTTSDNEGIVLKDGTDTKRHYTIGNFSKFVRPGYVRVDVNGNSNTDLLISAYKGTDAAVVVAINKGTMDATVPITIAGGTAPANCTPNVTSSSDNLVAKTAVPVSGGTFSASLSKATVTTFVCK